MKTLSVELLNEKFGTNETGEEIGYGEKAVRFREVECESLEDFHINAEIGQCWTDENGVTYFKIRNSYDDAEAFIINENGALETL